MDPNRPRTWRWMWSEAPPSPGRPSTRLPVVLRGERKTAQLRHLASREKIVECIGTFVLVRSVGKGCRATMWIIWKSYYFSECHFFLSLHNLKHFRFFNFTDKFYKVRQKCYWFLNLQRHLIFSTQNYSTISCTYSFCFHNVDLGYWWCAHRTLSVHFRYLLDSVTQGIHLSSTRSSSRILHSEENSTSKKKGWPHPARQLVSSAARITGSGYSVGKRKRVEWCFLRDPDWRR